MWAKSLVAFALVAAIALMAPAHSAAEECDPAYGCNNSEPPPQIDPDCGLSANSAAPGTRITATVTHIPPGAAVSLLFDGNEVADGTANSAGTAVLGFTVPDAPGANHTVVFSGAGFSCDATGGAGFEVLGAGVAGVSVERGGSSGSGSLAATGARLAVYLAIAILLIVVGWELVRVGRRRGRAIARQRHRELRAYSLRR